MFGGSTSGDLVQTISSFGKGVAADPMAAIGGQGLMQGAMDSAQEKQGWGSEQAAAIEYLKRMGRKPGADGKWDPKLLAFAYKNIMGMTSDQVQALMSAGTSASSSANYEQNIKAMLAQEKDQAINITSQNHLGTAATSKIAYRVATNANDLRDELKNDLVDPVHNMANSLGDAASRMAKYFNFGDAVQDSEGTFGDALKTVGGSGMDTLRQLKDADRLRSFYASNTDESVEKTLMQKLNDPAYASLKALSGMGAEGAWSKIQSMTNAGLASGLIGTASIYEQGDTVESLSKKLGCRLIGTRVSPGSSPTDQMYQQYAKNASDTARGIAERTQKYQESSQVDYKNSTDAINSLDSLDKNVAAITAIARGKAAPTVTSGSKPSLLDVPSILMGTYNRNPTGVSK